MEESLVARLLGVLMSGRAYTSLELAKESGQLLMRDVNPTLCSLQLEGKVRKVHEAPPTWQITPHGRASKHHHQRHSSSSSGAGYAAVATVGTRAHAQLDKAMVGGAKDVLPPIPNLDSGSSNLRTGLLSALAELQHPATALELAKRLGYETRKAVNPTLYALEREGVLATTSAGKGPPKWHLKAANQQHCVGLPWGGEGGEIISKPLVAARDSDLQAPMGGELPTKLMTVLRIKSDVPPLTALELSREIGGVPRSQTNSALYGLEKQGVVTKIEGQGPPKWKLSSAQLPGASHHVREVAAQDVKDSYDEMESSGSAADDMEVSEMSELSRVLANVPPLDVREQILAVLRFSGAVELTALDIACKINGAKLAGSSQQNRTGVTKLLNQLANENLVCSSAGFPVKWKLASLVPSTVVASPSHAVITLATQHQASPPDVLTAEEIVSDMNRNPVSKLSEYCQAQKLDLQFVEVREFGPPHRKHFVISASFGNQHFEAESTSKKEAKRMAADLALQSIQANQVRPVQLESVNGSPLAASNYMATFQDRVARMSHDFYHRIQETVHTPQPGRKVTACFLLEDASTNEMRVVSVGSGTRCITGDQMSLEGLVVNDSHAEVVARRSLLRYFYRQLMSLHKGGYDAAETIFMPLEEDRNTLARLRGGLKFHLYISTAPCGDGAQFSRDDSVNREPPASDDPTRHSPTVTGKSQGVLRTKMEGGEGTIPVGDDAQPQTWDGILHGGRLRTMSCSDKVGRWNVLGLQGALLSLFMEPVYVSSLTLGSLHHHGHLSRAVCCRFDDLSSGTGDVGTLPMGYCVNHPLLGRVQGGDEMKRHTDKTSNFSLNWCLGDMKGELNDGSLGRPVLPPNSPRSQLSAMTCSRISKANLFHQFVQLCQLANRSDLFEGKSYKEVKEGAGGFQQAKMALYQCCRRKGYGTWMGKPSEEKQFNTSIFQSFGVASPRP